MTTGPEIRMLPSADAAVPVLLDEIRALAARPGALLGLATGATFAPFLRALADELAGGRLLAHGLLATHLDEYLGFPPDRRGGMVHELTTLCPPLGGMLTRGTFLPVPHTAGQAALAAHAARLDRAGGVRLQLLGIGRNGHLAFNEPGTPFDSGFHVATLAPATRDDARARFAPDEPPTQAVTAGIATILAAERLLLCAFGGSKANAVRAMLLGEISPACPASAVRRHPNALVLLDAEAAQGLPAGNTVSG